MQSNQATGDLHPNDVAEPERANVALICSPAPQIPRPAMASQPRPTTRLNTLNQKRPPKIPYRRSISTARNGYTQSGIRTLIQRERSFHVSMRPLAPLPGVNFLSSAIASVITSYPTRRSGGKLYVNCMIATAAMSPVMV